LGSLKRGVGARRAVWTERVTSPLTSLPPTALPRTTDSHKHLSAIRRSGMRIMSTSGRTTGPKLHGVRIIQPVSSRWASLIVLCVGFLMIVVDSTIVNVALPSIRRDLGFSQSSLAWVVNAYLIAYGGLMLLAGRFGDLLGRKRIFLLGLAMFTAASLLC